MATRHPLVLNGGQIEQLQEGDTIAGLSVELDCGAPSSVYGGNAAVDGGGPSGS